MPESSEAGAMQSIIERPSAKEKSTMTSTATTGELLERLARDDKRRGLIEELNRLKESAGTLSTGQVASILGQWFHPLHYFPVFLSRLVSVAPNVEAQAE